MKRFKFNYVPLALSLLVLFTGSSWAETNAANAELNKYIAVYENRAQPVPRDIIKELEFSGISDTRLYDAVEKRLLDEYQNGDSENIDHTSWMAKTLAYSGHNKYVATLQEVSNTSKNRKLVKYAKLALERLPTHAVWNVDIQKDTQGLSGDALYRKRTTNMINSNTPYLTMMGARRVWFHHPTDKGFVAAASKKLVADANLKQSSLHNIDALAWLSNVLGKSEDVKYKAVLLSIAKTAPDRQVRKYAKKNARRL